MASKWEVYVTAYKIRAEKPRATFVRFWDATEYAERLYEELERKEITEYWLGEYGLGVEVVEVEDY